MKYSILGFNQERILEFKREEIKGEKKKVVAIDVTDLMILSEIADFMNRRNVIKFNIDEKTFFYVKYSIIMEDLPILNIKQQALADRLDKLCSFDLLEKHIFRNQSGSFTTFRIGEAYESITYSENISHLYSTTSANVSNYKCRIDNKLINDINYINSSTNNSIEKENNTNVLSKKNDFSLDLSIISDEMLSCVTTWLTYKKEKKQTYKPTGFVTFYKSLLKYSNNNPIIANAIIEKSMRNNYAGIFPLKEYEIQQILQEDNNNTTNTNIDEMPNNKNKIVINGQIFK